MSTGVLIAAGVALGVIYTLSPLAVLCTVALIAVVRWSGKGLTGSEQQWFFIVFTTAIVLRVIVIGGLVLSADGSMPYTVFFGDEWIFKSRPIWLRNIALDIPVMPADFIYAFDETGRSGHLYALAFVQSLVGDAPYGVHLFNVLVYAGSVALLYRLIRPAVGSLVALGGAVVLLYFPSLFAWSISALKEPLYIGAATLELLAAVMLVRGRGWLARVAAIPALVVLGFTMEQLRRGTEAVAVIGLVSGLALYWIVQRPGRIFATVIAAPVVLAAALAQPAVQDRLMRVAHESIKYHAGHVVSAGVTYKSVDPRVYRDWSLIARVDGREATRFLIRSVIAYFVEPLPRNWDSTLLQAYLPEHLAWLLLVLLAPFGIVFVTKRDPLVASMLLTHGTAIIMMVAITGGNIGTLIRHRDLSLPYLAWFSAAGAIALLSRVRRTAEEPEEVIVGHR